MVGRTLRAIGGSAGLPQRDAAALHHGSGRHRGLAGAPPAERHGFPELFAHYQRREQAVLVTVMDIVINGVSTRTIAAITEDLCGETLSKSLVSAVCQCLDPIGQGWNA